MAQQEQALLDTLPWHALQRWLETGERRVVIPYAPVLADMVAPVAVRLRRDCRTLLDLIRAHALLHRATRQRDAEGRIVASFDDYRVVHKLVADIIATGVEATVPISIRETVSAVAKLTPTQFDEASLMQVGKALGIDKSAASRRVRAALDLGYLRNLEPFRGRPLRLVLGDPLPDDVEILPTPEALTQRCCTVA